MTIQEIKKVQEDTRKQILKMVKGWVNNMYEGCKTAKNEKERREREIAYNEWVKAHLSIGFLKLKIK